MLAFWHNKALSLATQLHHRLRSSINLAAMDLRDKIFQRHLSCPDRGYVQDKISYVRRKSLLLPYISAQMHSLSKRTGATSEECLKQGKSSVLHECVSIQEWTSSAVPCTETVLKTSGYIKSTAMLNKSKERNVFFSVGVFPLKLTLAFHRFCDDTTVCSWWNTSFPFPESSALHRR